VYIRAQMMHTRSAQTEFEIPNWRGGVEMDPGGAERLFYFSIIV